VKEEEFMNAQVPVVPIAQLFSAARTHTQWQPRALAPEQLQQLYELTKWGPTSMNTQPARFVFVQSAAGKERLRPALAAGNVDKTMSAPLTVIVAYDPKFYERVPELFPAAPQARAMFADNAQFAADTAVRNSSLQGAYLIIAARALGLDTGPMSGFDHAKLDAEFFAESGYRSNFLINIGYGDHDNLYPRGPRLAFTEAVQVI